MSSILYLICDELAYVRAIEQALKVASLDAYARVISFADYEEQADGAYALSLEDYPQPVRIGRILNDVQRYITRIENAADKHVIGERFVLEPHNLFLHDQNTDENVRLTEKEHHILQLLAQKGGEIISKRQLLDEVWGYNEQIETHTLETHIYRLRQKIEEDPSQPSLLITDDEGGYCLSGG